MEPNPAKQMFTNDFQNNTVLLDTILKVDDSFDMVTRMMNIGGKAAKIYFIDGFLKDEVFERMMEYMAQLSQKDVEQAINAQQFIDKFITYGEAEPLNTVAPAVDLILSGALVLVVDGFNEVITIDARIYPIRDVKEPDNDKVLRGSRDGFVETLVFNAGLIRRRIRDKELVMKLVQVGDSSKTDVAVCYLDNKVDKELLNDIVSQINSIRVNALTFNQESLAESLVKKQWYNPFPKTRYTERPDAAAANILEGKIIILVDNSPAAMIIPTTFFDFVQETNDFYFPPFIGTYLRLLRILVYFVTLFLTPVWYLLIQNPDWLPSKLQFIIIENEISMPIIVQLIIVELLVDIMKMASLNTPSALNNSFSILGTLILGEFGVQAKWFVPETIFFMAFVAISNFAQPSFELGYAFKLFRIFILILTAIFNVWGFAAGVICMVFVIFTTKTVSNKSYFFPLAPFKFKTFLHLFFRRQLNDKNN